ncbi:alpha/beta fold hydrolase [Amycolatopsis sp. lyj-90]|uniref:alpha/beta fold hydrolase n=1 Tax=Amycolatopsis sp. lyj-90 TaxID=2789285 RepID=UPI00397CBB60
MFGTLDPGPRFGLIRWDQRGAGRSDPRGPYTLDRMVADVDAVREWHGLDRVVVLGHSWGAHLGLLYALARPERVSALVYVSGVGPGHDWHAEFKRAGGEARPVGRASRGGPRSRPRTRGAAVDGRLRGGRRAARRGDGDTLVPGQLRGERRVERGDADGAGRLPRRPDRLPWLAAREW